MNPTICRAGLALLLGVGGCQGQAQRADSHATASAAPIAPATRYRVDLLPDDQALGGEAPLVTVVLYSDYACPPCARTWAVLENLLEDYGDDLRVVVRSLTAPGFKAGEEAVEAALAAGAQGAFWPMHRRLFTAPPRERREIEAHAAALNLDLDRLREDLDTGAFTGPRLRQRRQALELGVAFGPVAFVNGRPVVGFHEEGEWHALIDAELAEARRRVAAGTPREGLYEAILEGSERAPIALEGEAAAARDALLAKIPPSIDDLELGPEPDEGRRYQVPLGGAVYYGPADAPVVIVAFMDAACPYCRRALSTALADLETRYPLELRLEIRHLPLPIHPSAEGAARAAIAAGRQGQFAAFYRALLTGEKRPLSRNLFVELAEGLGLDRARFLADLDDPEVAAEVRRDMELALGAGVQATPSFFINGRFYSGHREADVLAAVVDDEVRAAREAIDGGAPRGDVAAARIAAGDPLPTRSLRPKSPQPGEAEPAPPPSPATDDD